MQVTRAIPALYYYYYLLQHAVAAQAGAAAFMQSWKALWRSASFSGVEPDQAQAGYL